MKNEIRLTLIGGPTVLIEIAGFRLLTDPTFDPPRRYEAAKAGAVTLEKTAGPALAADALGSIDAILLSHDQHFDNLDHAGRAILPRAKQTLTTKVGAERLGGNAHGLAPWDATSLAKDGRAVRVTATPARHGPPGIEPISGEVVGFALGLTTPGDAVYITGDTVWYEGVAEVARRCTPRLVMVFAGSAEPRGKFHVTMDNNDALEVAHAFPQAKIAIVHNYGWAHFKETSEEAAEAFKTLGLADRLVTLPPGQAVTI